MSRHRTALPILPLVAAATGIAVFSVMDAAMKRASILAGVYVALLLRSLVGAMLMAPVWRLSGGRWPAGARLRVHAIRGVVTAGMAVSFFWGLVRTPMAEAMAISFIAPLIALYLAAAVLKERIRLPAILASLLGVAGVSVIAIARLHEAQSMGRVGAGYAGRQAGWGMASILVSAVLYAWNLILQRQQAQVSNPVEVALFQSLFVGLSLVVLAPWLFAPVPMAAWGLIGGAGALAVVSLMLLSWGWARAEAQLLLPLEYTAFIWATLLGWRVFGEVPRVTTLIGACLIVVGCWIGTASSHRAEHIEQTAL